MTMAFEALPADLKSCPQWILWRPEFAANRNKLTKIPYNVHTGHKAATDRPQDWATFEAAYARAVEQAPNFGLGFVFGYASGVSGIDLDSVFAADGSVLDFNAVEIARKFASYTEFSPSGTGLHTLIKAVLPSGRRFGNCEIYGQGRYFTITGNSYGEPLPLRHAQTEADELVGSIDARRQQAQPAQLDWSIPDRMTDRELFDMACRADNGQKFYDLWRGDWQKYGYPSQSEADFGLIDILSFYTDSAMQVQRLFKLAPSYRGAEKYDARQNLVIGMIQRSFDRKPPVILPQVTTLQPVATPVESTPANDDTEQPEPHAGDMSDEERTALHSDPYVLPPGGGALADVAQFIYAQAPYPMREAAMAAALALFAGICGRQFQVKGLGLNLYIILLANTGAGKEAMSMGIGKLFDAVCNPRMPLDGPPGKTDTGFESARGFRGPARLTGKGLNIALSKSNTLSFVSILTEFAYTLDQMKEGSRNVGQHEMRQTLLDLYMKSSEGNSFEGHRTADKETSIGRVSSPAFSLLAESTPAKLYGYLDDDMVTSGLLPRMIVVETNNITEIYNPQASRVEPSPQLVAYITALCHKVITFKVERDQRCQVEWTVDGTEREEAFRQYCRERLRSGSDATNELWNRAHLNAMRVAALAAIGQNLSKPTINGALFDWAANIVYRQVVLLVGKFTRGETGERDDAGHQLELVRRWLNNFRGFNPDVMRTRRAMKHYADARAAGVVPYSYFLYCAGAVPIFKKDRNKVAGALRTVIDTMKKTGELTPATFGAKSGEHYTFK